MYAWNESGMKYKGAKWGTNVAVYMQWTGMNDIKDDCFDATYVN